MVELKIDGRQSETATAVQRGTSRLLRDLGFAVLSEITLATGRRADIMALAGNGEIWIIEIKSSLEDYRADRKWQDYGEFCDRFFFAIPESLAPEIIPSDVGLIVADNWGAEIIRQSGETPLHPSRRKALTLAFGRVAALRLQTLYDP
jgi:hypothetical protein